MTEEHSPRSLPPWLGHPPAHLYVATSQADPAAMRKEEALCKFLKRTTYVHFHKQGETPADRSCLMIDDQGSVTEVTDHSRI